MSSDYRLKADLFIKLKELHLQIQEVPTNNTAIGKKILYSVDEIVSQFNKGKQKIGPKDLDLNSDELTNLKDLVNDIWLVASKKNIEVWPKPDIVVKVG